MIADLQMDLLTALPAQLPLIIPSTTIREVRHRSLPLHNRLQQLVQDEDRCVWVWWNEECRETATAAAEAEDEVVNDRNDRGELICPHQAANNSDPRDVAVLPRTHCPVCRFWTPTHPPHR